MKFRTKALLALLYASAVGLGSYLVYKGVARPDYAPATNSIVGTNGELKPGNTIKVGTDHKILFNTESDNFEISVYCPKSEYHNPTKQDCTPENKMIKMVLKKLNKY